MDDFDDFDPENRRPSILIAIIAAALSGAFVGMVAGAIGASLAFLTWGAS